MPVEISRYSFRVFVCACPSVISSIPGKSFHFPLVLTSEEQRGLREIAGILKVQHMFVPYLYQLEEGTCKAYCVIGTAVTEYLRITGMMV